MGNRIRLDTLLEDAKNTLEAAPQPKSERPITAPIQAEQLQPTDTTEGSGAASSAATAAIEPARRPARRAPSRRTPAPSESERIHYSSLVRKEARLRDDQIESLTLRARKLSRNKAATEPRITDNTLIRVAVDLLLAHEADLAGTSEAELRRSVGL